MAPSPVGSSSSGTAIGADSSPMSSPVRARDRPGRRGALPSRIVNGPDRPRDPRLSDLVADLLEDLEEGELRAVEHYRARYPTVSAEDVAREYERLTTETDVRAPEPERLGPYELGDEIARGGQGVVYRAHDPRLGRTVAIKRLFATFAGSPKLARFRREAEVLAQLDHPGICTVYEAALESETPYIAMQLVPGRTLAEVLADPKASELPPRDLAALGSLLAVFEGLARALHVAHEADVVHRDVKPANIVLTPSGEGVLLDFGLARIADDSAVTLTGPGELWGTPAYMSPEQLAVPVPGVARPELDRRTDVYSLAATLYECLTGEPPFAAATREALFRAIESVPPRNARERNPIVPTDLASVLEVALEKDPEHRYATAAARRRRPRSRAAPRADRRATAGQARAPRALEPPQPGPRDRGVRCHRRAERRHRARARRRRSPRGDRRLRRGPALGAGPLPGHAGRLGPLAGRARDHRARPDRARLPRGLRRAHRRDVRRRAAHRGRPAHLARALGSPAPASSAPRWPTRARAATATSRCSPPTTPTSSTPSTSWARCCSPTAPTTRPRSSSSARPASAPRRSVPRTSTRCTRATRTRPPSSSAATTSAPGTSSTRS